jgi:hypothetical protein
MIGIAIKIYVFSNQLSFVTFDKVVFSLSLSLSLFLMERK